LRQYYCSEIPYPKDKTGEIMTLTYKNFILGPIQNNSYLVYDDVTKQALVIDPPMEPAPIAKFILESNLILEKVFVTHGHFDHFYGLPYLMNEFSSIQEVVLHPADLDLWNSGGGARHFWGKSISVVSPNHLLKEGEILFLGEHQFTFRYAPGHSNGSVVYCSQALNCAFVGDVIFYHSIGRTDLDGGDLNRLLQSIRTQVFSLPEDTLLLPGHGESTTVAEEKANNPFLI
jgi:glyoxylase-like metal-dependent hydrolase (beta-lactamase superfamily II)